MMLHHGFAADTGLNWVAPGVVAALVAAGRSVLSVDARGHGKSDKPHDPAQYGEQRMARDLIEVFDHLGLERVDLAGYSMGAIVSLVTASLDQRIRRMVIGGIGGAVVERASGETRFDGRGLAAAMRADDPSTITHPMARAFRAFAESTGADRFALAAQAETVGRRQAIDAGAITATSLVLVGDRDELAARPEVLAAALGGAELRIVPGDHLGAVGAPEFAPAIVEFLARG